ncbi:MAG: MFS transporter [Clostridiales bacterium]|nr:MFS transporter [Clostridiales bacterium]MCF8022885.1 MFS transporter [Clostridiales bacterium]
MQGKMQKYLSILALSLSGGSIYLLPYIKYVFYDHQIEVMGITNQQSGLLLTMYAIGCILLYIPGGMVADRISTKKCLLFSLIATTGLALLYAFTFNFKLALVIWLLLALTTSFVFWTSLVKTIRMISNEDEQGRMFGLYYAGNGITGAVGNSLALWAAGLTSDPRGGLFNAVIVMAIATALSALFIAIFLKDNKKDEVATAEEEKFHFRDVGKLIRNPIVWVFSLIIFCGYSLYSSTTYFTPYLTSVVGVSPAESGVFSIIRTYLFMLLAPVGGYLADRIFKSTSKWFMIAFSLLALFFISVMFIPEGISPMFVSIFTLIPGALGLALYGVVFSVVEEARIPVAVTGTAVGIASIIGYSPDLFMSAMFGTWLDNCGNGGYTYIFLFLAGVCVLGLGCSYLIRRHSKKVDSSQINETA